jgi:hypothetical protein
MTLVNPIYATERTDEGRTIAYHHKYEHARFYAGLQPFPTRVTGPYESKTCPLCLGTGASGFTWAGYCPECNALGKVPA